MRELEQELRDQKLELQESNPEQKVWQPEADI
jgi:hypothetical protein